MQSQLRSLSLAARPPPNLLVELEEDPMLKNQEIWTNTACH